MVGACDAVMMTEISNALKVFPKTRYIQFFGRRLVFRDGKYHGWYRP